MLYEDNIEWFELNEQSSEKRAEPGWRAGKPDQGFGSCAEGKFRYDFALGKWSLSGWMQMNRRQQAPALLPPSPPGLFGDFLREGSLGTSVIDCSLELRAGDNSGCCGFFLGYLLGKEFIPEA